MGVKHNRQPQNTDSLMISRKDQNHDFNLKIRTSLFLGESMKPIATVVNNNQPGWQNIVETEPKVTLPVGAKLFLAEPFAAIGSPLGGGFFAGEMTIGGELYALVVAPKASGESGEELQFKIEDWRERDGAASDLDGMVNAAVLSGDNYPAAHFCKSLQIGGFDDWYLPSRDELAQLWRNLGPRRANAPELFHEGAAEAFQTDWYWSSTESASYSGFAWGIDFYNGYQYDVIKDTNFGVRAVRRLKI
jgi:hypothetical protein